MNTRTTDSTTDDTWVNRVNALLAKAESTEFPDEAEALMAKVQELMARHAIDEAMLAAAGHQATDQVDTETILIEAPYATAKATLLGAVANANHCRCVMGGAGEGRQACVVVGHRADLANVRTLFAALSLHAVRSMLAAPVPRGDTVRRFRHAFLLAFAARVSERLTAARVRVETEATQSGGPGVGLVLAGRVDAVEQAFRQAFPRVRTARTTSSSAAGRVWGRQAADQAEIHRPVAGGRRRSLPKG
ncbi:MAG: DUF2786 domain-containing protein [Aquihabitans sp.]